MTDLYPRRAMRPAWVYWVVGTGVAGVGMGLYSLIVEAIPLGATLGGFIMGLWGSGLTIFGLVLVTASSPPNPVWS